MWLWIYTLRLGCSRLLVLSSSSCSPYFMMDSLIDFSTVAVILTLIYNSLCFAALGKVDLMSWKRVEILCFYMGRPDLSLPLFEKVPQMLMKLINTSWFINENRNLYHYYLSFPSLNMYIWQILLENRDQDYVYGMLAFPLLELGHWA